MGFGWAGAAAGAAQSVRDILERRRMQELQQAQAAQQAIENQRAERRMQMDERQFNAGETDRASDRAYRDSQVARQSKLDERDDTDRRRTFSKETNAAGVRQLIAGGLKLKTTTPEDAALMAFGEGVDVSPDTLDPGRQQRQKIDFAKVQQENELEQIGAQGRESRATASVRSAGTRDAATQRRIDSKTKGFDSNPTVKRAQALAESANFVKSLDNNTTNPADDQGLIYNFAKSMDPDSAVRDGEYATVQKYAQSLAERFGFNAARVFSNSTFLTPEARKNLKDTILSRWKATRGQYDNLRKSYATQISGMGGDEDDLIDYGAGFPALDDAGGGPVPMVTPDGRRITVPADQVNEAVKRGAKPVQ